MRRSASRALLVGGCLFAPMALTACSPKEHALGVAFEPVVIDFGTMHVGEAHRQRIALRNRDSVAHIVSELRPGCGCLKLELDTGEVPPYSTILGEAILTGEKARRIRTYVVVYFRDGTSARLEVRADVDATIDARPASIAITYALPGEVIDDICRIRCETAGEVRCAARFESSPSGERGAAPLEVTANRVERDDAGARGNGISLAVRVAPDAAAGLYCGTVTVGIGTETIDVPLLARVRLPLP